MRPPATKDDKKSKPIVVGRLLRFMSGTVQPSFTADAQAADKYPQESRFSFVKVSSQWRCRTKALDIPGSSHLLTYAVFPILAWNCLGSDVRCAALSTASAQQALLRAAAAPQITLTLYADGPCAALRSRSNQPGVFAEGRLERGCLQGRLNTWRSLA
jgi:hypothetical protein